ncbi:MAG: PilN domain-containing protein [Methyloversatilis sp.]|jgi:type IV pilus assembly protein PilN|uniref:PilN domain-containing protein n=1 Tax=Methyloversatilis sp. TaxID=2569862 RepID=UPI000DB04225|nr:PilN domain-containing protein [Methyloversatilis sp.]MCR6667613.1 PilN domain-containing protein [Methyloversatilis sp.]PZU52638.1 MAG: fimbrial protein [Thauera sp.]
MIRINLLPHREEKRKARRQQFYALTGLTLVLGGLIVALGNGIISGYVSAQDEKNAFLKTEIAALDKSIDEIKRLREQTDALLQRKRVIESLQGNRSEAVGLFNELAKNVPEGVYIKKVSQQANKINLVGYAQSNARVSSLMRNLESSPLLERPTLIEIKGATVDKRRMNEFSLDLFITRAADEADSKTAKGRKT